MILYDFNTHPGGDSILVPWPSSTTNHSAGLRGEDQATACCMRAGAVKVCCLITVCCLDVVAHVSHINAIAAGPGANCAARRGFLHYVSSQEHLLKLANSSPMMRSFSTRSFVFIFPPVLLISRLRYLWCQRAREMVLLASTDVTRHGGRNNMT